MNEILSPFEILASLAPLIQKARAEHQWLAVGIMFETLYFTADELEEYHKKGRYIWGLVNWRLVDPQTRIFTLQNEIARHQAEIDRNKQLIEKCATMILSRSSVPLFPPVGP